MSDTTTPTELIAEARRRAAGIPNYLAVYWITTLIDALEAAPTWEQVEALYAANAEMIAARDAVETEAANGRDAIFVLAKEIADQREKERSLEAELRQARSALEQIAFSEEWRGLQAESPKDVALEAEVYGYRQIARAALAAAPPDEPTPQSEKERTFPQFGDLCTCGHPRIGHQRGTVIACIVGDCTCARFVLTEGTPTEASDAST